ncbi:MAG: FtsH protease activity modulator HflK [Lachnospiraceae bacterium]|nr:FtsH protease activity modulator HflK [Lachnospiraceae bacterium]
MSDANQVNENAAADKVFKAIRYVIIGFFVVVTVLNSFYSVKETETAVITTFGKASIVEGKGLKFKIPYIQKVVKVDTTVRGFSIGYYENEDGTTGDVDEESVMITSDYNFVDIDFYISYEVKDPIKYLYDSDQPEMILKNIAMSSIRSTLSAYTVDTALTTGKAEIQSNIKQMIIAKLDSADIGITLVDASIQDVEPPTDDIKNAFKAVETAKQQKESAINEANKYRNEQLPAAEAQADKILQDAEATKTARINEATGEVARFNAEFEEYKKYPLITKQRMFYEAMEDLLPRLKVIIDDGSGNIQKYYPIESFANVGTSSTSGSSTSSSTTSSSSTTNNAEEAAK